ncbi:MAG TPA: aminotransferase class IV, partial [Mycobacteriales bacterium]|nr:aminotransferase class IV [Mycobacteriales bacterium]
ERNRDLIVNVNGRLTHRDQAGVSPFDSIVQGGDAVWEGLRLYDGRIFALDEHLARLRRSATALAFVELPSDEEIVEQIRRTLEANAMTDGVHIRLTLTRGLKITSGMDPRLNRSGPTLIVLAEHKPPVYDRSGISLVTASIRRSSPDVLDPKIHHNNLLGSILAKIEANAAGADDAIMLDSRGFIAETNATHLFFVADGVLCTSTTVACPEGITRATVLVLAGEAELEVAVGDFSLPQLYSASEAFVTGTMGELAAVRSVDGRAIGTAPPGPVTTELSDAFATLTAKSGTRVVG